MFIFLALASILTAGFFYQWIGSRRDRRLMTPGRLVSISRSISMYIVNKGENGPPVIFESGFAASSLNWTHIQDALSEEIETVAYDRCGLGWSSKAASPRTPSRIAAELHHALNTAGVEPPYLLVGHSFGGLVARRFALDYPGDVVGLVLIDPARTCEWPPYNALRHATLRRARRLSRAGIWFARFGGTRLAVHSLLGDSGELALGLAYLCRKPGQYLHRRLTCELGKLPRSTWPAICAHWSSPRFYSGLLAHTQDLDSAMREMHDAPPIAGIPIRVLTPDNAEPLSGHQLACIGGQAEQIIVPNSGHWVHLDDPALVIETILSLHAGAAETSEAEMRAVSARR